MSRKLFAFGLLASLVSFSAASAPYHCDMSRGVLGEKGELVPGGVNLKLYADGFEVISQQTGQRNVVTEMKKTKPEIYQKEEANGDSILLSVKPESPSVQILTKSDKDTPWLLVINNCRKGASSAQ